MSKMTLEIMLAIGCMLGSTTRLTAQESAPGVDPSQSQRVHELIEQLASPSFSEREYATSAILEIGTEALAYMNDGPDADVERRYRISQIKARIETDRFELLSGNFLKDPNPDNSHGLTAWEPFCSLVGSTRTSKLLFLDMLKQQPELMTLISNVATGRNAVEKPQTSRATSSPQDLLLASVSSEAAKLMQERFLQYPEIGDIVAILLAVSQIEGQAPIEVNELLDISVHSVPVTSYMQRRGYQDTLRRLYSLWIPKTHDAMAVQAIYIAMYNHLETGADVARKHLEQNRDTGTREEAIRCLSRFGNRGDIPALLALLDDQSLCDEFSVDDFPFFAQGIAESNEPPPGARGQNSDGAGPPKGGKAPNSPPQKQFMVYRINDLALAAAMMLSGEDPKSIFPNFVASDIFGFENRSVAVPRDEVLLRQRQENILGWKSRYEAGVAR